MKPNIKSSESGLTDANLGYTIFALKGVFDTF